MDRLSLQRQINLTAAIALVAGSVIGSSIFAKPASMAQVLPDPVWILAAWLVAGLLSLSGAMINAEIGAMFPKTGGQFVYFREMYGQRFAFIYGWASLTVINTASVAAIAFVFAQYLSFFADIPTVDENTAKQWALPLPFIGNLYPLQNLGIKLIAACIVILLTAFNHFSLKTGNKVQLFFTWLKVLLLLLIVITIFSSGKGDITHLHATGNIDMNMASVLAFVAALSGAFAAFDGWNNLGFVAGELRNPEKQIPKALWIGLSICFFLYVSTHLAFFYMLGTEKAAASSLIATDAILPVMGNIGASFIAIMVMISTFGAVNGNILACSRLTFSMGENKDFFPWTGKVHPRFHTPSHALWLHAAISVVYIFTGSFDMLADLFVFITWIFYGFGAWGLLVLRKKYPHLTRPYKIKYLIIPVIFTAFALVYAVLTLYNDITAFQNEESPFIKSVLGIVIVLSGLVLYEWKAGFWKNELV